MKKQSIAAEPRPVPLVRSEASSATTAGTSTRPSTVARRAPPPPTDGLLPAATLVEKQAFAGTHLGGNFKELSALQPFELGHPSPFVLRDPQVPGAAPDGRRAFLKSLSTTDVYFFDIDNTLVDTRPRHLEALRALLERGKGLTPADKKALRSATLESVRYRPEQTAAVLGLSPGATAQYVQLWNEVFSSPEVARAVDVKMGDVIELMRLAHEAGKPVRCLSARTIEYWGDEPWKALVEKGLEFLRPEDVMLKSETENTIAFKKRVLGEAAATGQSVALLTDAPEEIEAAQQLSSAGAPVSAIQVQFPYVPKPAEISPDTPLVPFPGLRPDEIKTQTIGVVVGSDGKKADIITGAPGVNEKGRTMARNFAAGITQLLNNTLVLDTPRQLPLAAPSLSPDRHARIAVGGFFRPPQEAHHEVVARLLNTLVDELGDKNVAFLTSATTASGSLERVVTEVSEARAVPNIYFTANHYLGMADLEALPQKLRPHYDASTKVVLPRTDLYGWAEMATSTALVNTGGQQAAVSDFVKAIQLSNPVALVVNRDLGPLQFDVENERPSNGADYLSQMLAARQRIVDQGRSEGLSDAAISARVKDPSLYPFPFMPSRNFTGDFLAQNGDQLAALVRWFEIDGETDVRPVAAQIGAHLKFHLGLT